MDTSPTSLQFFRIPKDDPEAIKLLATKYRELRLAGLSLSPESFSSTLEAESQYPEATWQERLTRPGFETFICATTPQAPAADDHHSPADTTSTTAHPDTQWIAQVTLRGPISASAFALPPASGQPVQTPAEALVEERWQVLALYMHPDHRGRGLAQRVCEEAFGFLGLERLGKGEGLRALRLRAMVKPGNVASLALFRKMGFVEAGRCLLKEALVANGEGVSRGIEGEGEGERSGWILMKVIER